MPCAGPDYSCSFLIKIRSPLGEVRLGGPKSVAPSSRLVWFLAKTYLCAREWLAHRKQRRALVPVDLPMFIYVSSSIPQHYRPAQKSCLKKQAFRANDNRPVSCSQPSVVSLRFG